MYAKFCDIYSPSAEKKFSEAIIRQRVGEFQKEDKYRIVKLTRVNPNGEYGNYTIERSITKEQLSLIEDILGVNLNDYKFN